jgi:RHS repeat-associated protein
VRKEVIPAERADFAGMVKLALVAGKDALPKSRVVEFLWDGNVLAGEIESGAEKKGRVFVHHPGTFVPMLQAEDGAVFTYVNDHLGMPKELVDPDGRVAWAGSHSAWGRVAETWRDPRAKRGAETPFRLLGQYADVETGLCYTRFRYFDAGAGRWCSPDPIGIWGGNNSLAFNDSPTCGVDALGLEVYFVGENQPRVVKAARQLGGKTIMNDWPEHLKFQNYDPLLHEEVSIEYNRQWIRDRMDAGDDLVDIGRDPKRVAANKPMSKFYAAELEEIQQRGYGKYAKIKLRSEKCE